MWPFGGASCHARVKVHVGPAPRPPALGAAGVKASSREPALKGRRAGQREGLLGQGPAGWADGVSLASQRGRGRRPDSHSSLAPSPGVLWRGTLELAHLRKMLTPRPCAQPPSPTGLPSERQCAPPPCVTVLLTWHFAQFSVLLCHCEWSAYWKHHWKQLAMASLPVTSRLRGRCSRTNNTSQRLGVGGALLSMARDALGPCWLCRQLLLVLLPSGRGPGSHAHQQPAPPVPLAVKTLA